MRARLLPAARIDVAIAVVLFAVGAVEAVGMEDLRGPLVVNLLLLAVICAIIGMFLPTDAMVPWQVLVCGTAGITLLAASSPNAGTSTVTARSPRSESSFNSQAGRR